MSFSTDFVIFESVAVCGDVFICFILHSLLFGSYIREISFNAWHNGASSLFRKYQRSMFMGFHVFKNNSSGCCTRGAWAIETFDFILFHAIFITISPSWRKCKEYIANDRNFIDHRHEHTVHCTWFCVIDDPHKIITNWSVRRGKLNCFVFSLSVEFLNHPSFTNLRTKPLAQLVCAQKCNRRIIYICQMYQIIISDSVVGLQ